MLNLLMNIFYKLKIEKYTCWKPLCLYSVKFIALSQIKNDENWRHVKKNFFGSF